MTSTIERLNERRKQDEGFTLIELLVVIVILGILAAVVVFAVGGITDRGEASACEATAKTVETASEAFRAQSDSDAPAVDLQALYPFLRGSDELPTDGDIITMKGGGTITYHPNDGTVTDDCPA